MGFDGPGGTHGDPPPELTNSQNGSRGVLGQGGRGETKGTLGHKGEHRWQGCCSGRKVCPTEGKTGEI